MEGGTCEYFVLYETFYTCSNGDNDTAVLQQFLVDPEI